MKLIQSMVKLLYNKINPLFQSGGFAFFPWPNDEIGGDIFIDSLYTPNDNDGYYEYLVSVRTCTWIRSSV